jgi:hypothetical protein
MSAHRWHHPPPGRSRHPLPAPLSPGIRYIPRKLGRWKAEAALDAGAAAALRLAGGPALAAAKAGAAIL